jgi:hypothetical protein
MKKSKYPGYQALPARSGSPLDRRDLERGGSSQMEQQAPSRPSFNPAALIGRRVSQPLPNDVRVRGQRTGPSGKPLAPGQVKFLKFYFCGHRAGQIYLLPFSPIFSPYQQSPLPPFLLRNIARCTKSCQRSFHLPP